MNRPLRPRVMRPRSCRLFLAVPLVAVLLMASGCAAHERSVKPGINDPYKAGDLKVDVWVERFETESREVFSQREKLLAELALRPGEAVADIGAGTGLFTPLMSRAVGNRGVVYAVDIVPAFLEHVAKRAAEAGLGNVRTVLCREDSVGLPDASIDVALICDTYHHFEYPRSTMTSLHRALRPGGRVVVVDFKRVAGESSQWVLDHVRAGQEVVIREIEEAGFERAATATAGGYLKENYVLAFRRR